MKDLPPFLPEKYRLPVGIFLVAAVVVGGGVLTLLNARSRSPEIHKIEETPSRPESETTTSATPSETQPKMKIDVAGAVVNPGVYEIAADERVEGALNAAGGLSDRADRDWVAKNLNLAAKLHDGDKLYITEVGETAAPSSVSTPTTASPLPFTGVVSGGSNASNCSSVNINTASAGTLADCLPGIGATKAQSIVKYREEHGGFKSIEEIKNVSGIAEGTFAKIKDQISVN